MNGEGASRLRARCVVFDECEPQLTDPDGTRHWLVRAANFVVCFTRGAAGAALVLDEQPDEYMLLLPVVGARIAANGAESVTASGGSLVIVPPGASRVELSRLGEAVRIFTSCSEELAGMALNAADYETRPAGVAPLEKWPDPRGGYRVRVYELPARSMLDAKDRVYRSTSLMLNAESSPTLARDTTRLTPHLHPDFEQGSLCLTGTWVHHIRYPWTPNMRDWLDDEHIECGSPSLTIIPHGAIHTTRNTGQGLSVLRDIFAPPRIDFSLRPSLVRNADEYPISKEATWRS
jgi:hypothetical protein